ncbi:MULTISPECIES: Hsp20/alpha crystallin family protein [Dehalococcoides]|uniref:Heat shock protein, HSP20 family n=3 Tax=Dehalococcoides mccartyi TaxID=61435 RepID=A0A142V9W4_9CHLR|nr:MULTISPECIES: Hsp20/alpha crystallin family protein [Dehalococcoides]AGG06499.1 heat shock protein, Hsp20 family [Dehalococcoides mccartyi DCMB5]AII61009.1 molecular chaperone Hsp20 [Dehalococcoides mccartyi CG5]AMU86633.1 heat shock protein, HSP20 family [Dehalococcoides mccartyi]AQU05939.1 molecular chaperone Hsp20 [Dehalococcoides mccartyi]AQU07384.1 molecular chaperone Hsp20 [Dehalococcoides mccartyi]
MTLERWQPGWSLRPWRPFREVLSPGLWNMLTNERDWLPATEMVELKDKYLIKAEMPGINEEDIEVSVSDNVLSIKGEKKCDCEISEENYYFSERSYGSFSRSMTLPNNTDPQNIAATLDNGILEITIPKSSEAKPKKVSVIKAAKPKKTDLNTQSIKPKAQS